MTRRRRRLKGTGGEGGAVPANAWKADTGQAIVSDDGRPIIFT